MPIEARTGVTQVLRRARERLVHVEREPGGVGRGARRVGHEPDQRARARSSASQVKRAPRL